MADESLQSNYFEFLESEQKQVTYDFIDDLFDEESILSLNTIEVE